MAEAIPAKIMSEQTLINIKAIFESYRDEQGRMPEKTTVRQLVVNPDVLEVENTYGGQVVRLSCFFPGGVEYRESLTGQILTSKDPDMERWQAQVAAGETRLGLMEWKRRRHVLGDDT